jgi:hypothetical protein
MNIQTTEKGSSPKSFKVGTLVYTKTGLFILFSWLLWADMTFTLMESVPCLIPLKLKALNTPNWLMAVITSTLPSILNATVCPWVSYKSDRHRSKWGRRIPFILFTAPFLTIALVCIGFSQPLGRLLQTVFTSCHLQVSSNAVELGVVAVFGTIFAFFNMFVNSVFWYLFNDVVPAEVMSRFLSALRIVSTGASMMFSFFIFPFAGTHMPWIFLGGALLYFVSFVFVCLNVKEGEYPPVSSNEKGESGLLSGIKTYGRECYSHSFYWLYFLQNAIYNLAGSVMIFAIFLSLHLGLTYAQLGFIGGISSIFMVLFLYPAGILVDRIHPMYGALISTTLTTFVIMPIGLIWLFYDPTPKQVYTIILCISPFSAAVMAIGAASLLPLEMHLFPKASFGQFGSANALVRSVAQLIGGLSAGIFMDVMKRWCHGTDYCYRFIPLWWLPFGLIAYGLFIALFRRWKSMGGASGYVPPTLIKVTINQ